MIGKKIAQLRKKKKMSQTELGNVFGISQGAVSQWERGVTNPDIESIKIMAEIFEVNLSELLGGESASSLTQKEAPADDPLTEQIMAKAQKMSDKERLKLLKLIDLVVEGEL